MQSLISAQEAAQILKPWPELAAEPQPEHKFLTLSNLGMLGRAQSHCTKEMSPNNNSDCKGL